MKNQFLILVSLLLMLTINYSVANEKIVTSGWNESEYIGNDLQQIIRSPDYKMFGIDKISSNFYQSSDFGKTWTFTELPYPIINDITVDENGAIYAACDDGILIKNNGDEWILIDTLSSRLIDIYVSDDFNVIIATCDNGVLYYNKPNDFPEFIIADTLPHTALTNIDITFESNESGYLLYNSDETTINLCSITEDVITTFIKDYTITSNSFIFLNNNPDINFITSIDNKLTKISKDNNWDVIMQSDSTIENITNIRETNSNILCNSNNMLYRTNNANFNTIYIYPNPIDLLYIDANGIKGFGKSITYLYTNNGGHDLTLYKSDDIDFGCSTETDSLTTIVEYFGKFELTYNWTPDTCLVTNNTQTVLINPTLDTTYIVTVTDGFISISDTINITVEIVQNTKICIIANDPETNNNVIVIDQSNYNYNNYNIYKEIQGEYTIIGEIKYGEESIFIDPETPKYPDYYKVSITDNCGNETETSVYHKTLFLQANLGTSGEHNLDWSPYEGIDNIKYQIVYGGTERTSMVPLDTIFNVNTNKYTNITPESNTMYYQIGIVKESICNYEFTNTKSGSIDYTQSVSNILEYIETPVSIKTNNMLEIKISPNPAIDQVKINIPTYYISNTPTTIRIYSTAGQIVYNQTTTNSEEFINIESLQTGLYLLTIENVEGIGNSKLIKK